MKKSEGSVAIEALLLVPALFIFASFIVFANRYTNAIGNVQRAADVAARIASQSAQNSAIRRAETSALQTLEAQSSDCVSPTVLVNRYRTQREVHYEVRVSCSINLRGLSLLSVGVKRVTATSSEVVDVYTFR